MSTSLFLQGPMAASGYATTRFLLLSQPSNIDMSSSRTGPEQQQQQQQQKQKSLTPTLAAAPMVGSPPTSPLSSSSLSSPFSSFSSSAREDGIPSPSQSRAYPISSSTARVLRRRREEFFQGTPTTAGGAGPSSPGASTPLAPQHPHMLTPGPLSVRPATVQRRRARAGEGGASRASPSLDPFARSGSTTSRATSRDDMDQNASARLMRQRFRERCQAVMARDRARAVARSRRGFDAAPGAADSQDSEGDMGRDNGISSNSDGFLMSDDLSGSSDADDFDVRGDWEEEDEEMIRRVMTAEYRSMLRAQEHSGRVEVGWLGPEEVAWLEEEMRREERQPIVDPDEPPADMIDEDETLSALYYAHTQEAAASKGRYMSDEDEDGGIDDEWLANVDVDLDGGTWQQRGDDKMDMS